ncbi:hypothetical protein ACFL1I_03250 [Candidatus Omnitrophota bacterium]
MADLKKICRLRMHLKLVSFFHENQSTVDTAQAIAAWLNQSHKEIETSLDYLVNQKILNIHRTGSTVAYGYTQDKKTIDEIENFIKKG